MPQQPEQHVDVLIVGAGLSGIGAACHLQAKCPGRSYAILEGRERSGGTWDLFRYPGVRSDSDMYTLGYRFSPWTQPKSIADGPAILGYLRDTAAQHGIERHIRFNHRVVRAAWSTPDACWSGRRRAGPRAAAGAPALQLSLPVQRLLPLRRGLHARVRGQRRLRRAHRASAALARRPRRERAARGRHRQRRHRDDAGARAREDRRARHAAAALADLRGGAAGATALPNALRRVLPARLAYGITRWKNVLLGMFFFGSRGAGRSG
jgi:monooxygenase